MSDSITQDTTITEIDYTQANFSDTDLSGTLFQKCNLTKADFRKAKNYLINPALNTMTKSQFAFPEAIHLLDCFDIDIR